MATSPSESPRSSAPPTAAGHTEEHPELSHAESFRAESPHNGPPELLLDEVWIDCYLAGEIPLSEGAPAEIAVEHAALHHGPVKGVPNAVANMLDVFLDRIDAPERVSSDFATLMRTYERRAAERVLGRSSRQLGWATQRIPRGNAMGSRAKIITALAASVLAAGSVAALFHLQSADHVTREWARYTTAAGERTTVVLRDGTRVTVAPGSTVLVDTLHERLDAGDNATSRAALQPRTMHVIGQAFVDIAPNAAHPFTVTTPHSTTHVLGTAFSVREYPNDTFAEVAVQSGRVALDHTVLAAGHIGRLAQGRVTERTDAAAVARATAWVHGRLVFHDVRVRDLLPELSRWYGVTFVASDSSIGALHFSGAFDVTSGSTVNMSDVIDVLEQTLALRVEQRVNPSVNPSANQRAERQGVTVILSPRSPRS